MAKIEQGEGKLLAVDTEKKVLRFQEIGVQGLLRVPQRRKWELPYTLDWEDQKFFDLVGKRVEYVLSDGAVVILKSAS